MCLMAGIGGLILLDLAHERKGFYMTQKEFQQQVLSRLDGIEGRLDGEESRLTKVEARLEGDRQQPDRLSLALGRSGTVGPEHTVVTR